MPFSLSQSQVAEIRRSVEYIWTNSTGLSDVQKGVIIDIFAESCRRAFIIIVPAAIASGAAALLIRNWNIKKRGKP